MTDINAVVERREQIARIIDPSAWRVFDGYLAEVKRKHHDQYPGFDASAFKHKDSLAKADTILALEAAELERLRDERDQLALAILGGEDAPGLAASLSVDEIGRIHRENYLACLGRAEAAEARVKAMEEGLRPFKLAIEQYETDCFFATKEASIAVPDGYKVPLPGYEDEADAPPLTLGDFRRAASLLQQGGES